MRRLSPEWVAVVLTIAAMLVGGVIWGARLEERVNAQDRDIAAVEESHKDADAQLRDDVAYIRRRLDEFIDRGGLR